MARGAGKERVAGSTEKPLRFVGDSLKTLRSFPQEVRKEIGGALYFAQLGKKHPSASPMKGFGGAGVLEIIENYDTNTYRAVYTVKLRDAVYVLHVFQKKSKKEDKTPKHDLDLIKVRLDHAKKQSERLVAAQEGSS